METLIYILQVIVVVSLLVLILPAVVDIAASIAMVVGITLFVFYAVSIMADIVFTTFKGGFSFEAEFA